MHAIVPVASCARVWSTRSAISWPGTSSPRSRCSSRIVRASEAITQSIPEPPPDAQARFRCQTPPRNRHALSTTPAQRQRVRCQRQRVRCQTPARKRADTSTKARLIAEHRADALDRVEVLAAAERPDGAAVGEGLVHDEVEAVTALLHPRPVQWTGAVRRAEAPAGRALPDMPVDPVLEEQQLDPSVGGGFERLPPARGGAAVATGSLAPALHRG